MSSPEPGAPNDPYAVERDAVRQYVLPLVVRIERAGPPTRTDALEGAARAVLAFLAGPRVADGGEWAEAYTAWESGRIRKVVRRARGAEWRRAIALPGITVTAGSAEVRVFPPVPVDEWPSDLARLQVSGTDLGDSEPPGPPEPETAVFWLNPGLPMTAGKAMAQVGHAAQIGWWRLTDEERTAWAAKGFPLAVRVAEPDRWAALAGSELPVVRDAGFTEIAPGSHTVVADLPSLREPENLK